MAIVMFSHAAAAVIHINLQRVCVSVCVQLSAAAVLLSSNDCFDLWLLTG